MKWWREAIAGNYGPVYESEPQAGFYVRKFRKDGPEMPVRIWLHQDIDPETGLLADDEVMKCQVGDWTVDPLKHWSHVKPVSEVRYFALRMEFETAKREDPNHPMLFPFQPVDPLRKAPLPPDKKG